MRKATMYAFASGKGGVGKTLLSAAFGVMLSRRGQRVLLMDGDMGMRNMDLVLGVQDDCFYHILDLAEGRCFAHDVILHVAENLDFLPAANGVTWDEVFPAAMETVLEDVGGDYDAIVYDCPAGRGEGITFAAEHAAKLFAVVVPSYASKRNAEELVSRLPRKVTAQFLLNQFTRLRKGWLPFREVQDELDPDSFLGVVPYSLEADRLAHEGEILRMDRPQAFGKAVDAVVRSAVEDVEYPLSRWESFIRLADAENEAVLAGRAPGIRRQGLSWHSSSPAYRHRRR